MDQDFSSLDLLESVHTFPGPYQIKVIGAADNGFIDRVLAAVVSQLATPGDVEHTVRSTPGGRHVSVTFELQVQSAQQVRDIYAAIRPVEGVAFLL